MFNLIFSVYSYMYFTYCRLRRKMIVKSRGSFLVIVESFLTFGLLMKVSIMLTLRSHLVLFFTSTSTATIFEA